jgi:hypothetical protein
MQIYHVESPPAILNYSALLLYAILSSCIVHYAFLIFYDDPEMNPLEVFDELHGM